MRFIPANCLREGQILASNLVCDKSRVLLRRGVTLTDPLIYRIRKLGYQGVYIDDDISSDIEVVNIISDELKYKAQSEIRSLFVSLENNLKTRLSSHTKKLSSVIENIVDEILQNRDVMVNVIDIRTYDDYTFSHSLNVSVLACVLGTVLGLDRHALNELTLGALIHDIGKVFIDKQIINKAGRLTTEEFEEIKKHSSLGSDYLSSNELIPDLSRSAVLSHHEKFDGTGYPFGLKGADIPLFGRVVCVADVYDALISDRPYRRAMQPSDAIEYILAGYNTMFDPQMVDAFTRKVAPFPVGTCVMLSTNDTGLVVKNYEGACLRPKVKIIRNGKLSGEIIDLARDASALNITIKGIVNC